MNITTVTCGSWHTGAVDKDQNLYMWGRGDVGQIGNGQVRAGNYPSKQGLHPVIAKNELSCASLCSVNIRHCQRGWRDSQWRTQATRCIGQTGLSQSYGQERQRQRPHRKCFARFVSSCAKSVLVHHFRVRVTSVNCRRPVARLSGNHNLQTPCNRSQWIKRTGVLLAKIISAASLHRHETTLRIVRHPGLRQIPSLAVLMLPTAFYVRQRGARAFNTAP